WLGRLPQGVPQLPAQVGGGVQLPAQLADVGEAHRGDGDGADVGALGAEVLQAVVREVRVGEGPQDLAGERAPQADAAGARGDVTDLDRALGGEVAGEPVEVQVAVGADLEEVAGQPGDGDIAADAAVLVQQEGVRDGADGIVDPAGGQPLQEGGGPGTCDLEALEG